MTDSGALSEENDHELVFRAKNGDNHAFDLLMVRHQSGVSSYLRRYSASPQVVEELTQTVFVKAYMNLAAYRPVAPFMHWLKVIASRVGYDFWRQEKKERGVSFHGDMDVYAEKPADAPFRNEEFERLSRVINRLEPEEKQVLYMLHVDGISVADIAKTMGWNHSMTKMRAFRARNKLRKILQSEGE